MSATEWPSAGQRGTTGQMAPSLAGQMYRPHAWSGGTKGGTMHPVMAAFELLSQMGVSGKHVWMTAKAIDDPQAKLFHLQQAIRHFRRFKGSEHKYVMLPVDPLTFVDCSELLNMSDEVYPKIKTEIAELCSGPYVEAVLTGSIGCGKTTIALIATAYSLYELSCLKQPHKEFGLAQSSEIEFVFQSLKKELSKAVDYMRFKAMLDGSPYFQDVFRYDRGIESELRFPKRIIVKPLSGDHSAAIGQNVFGGVLDEVNFMAVVENSKSAIDGGTYDQARQVYNAIARRRESRFMKQGRLPGMLCLVSSKQYPGEFTDRKITEARTNPSIFIYDKRAWDVKPEGTFSGDWFEVFVGDATRKPRVLDPDEAAAMADTDDVPLVMAVPEEYRHAFDSDLLAALRDIAGVSTLALHPFMLDIDAVTECFGLVPSVLSQTECDFAGQRVQIYPQRFVKPEEPRFAHVDLGLTGDSCGFAVGHVQGFADMYRGEEIETLPIVRLDCTLEIRPPKGGEIAFENVRRLLYKLRELGLNIKWVTLDSWQSADTMQILMQRGFIAGLLSMDTSTVPYDVTKQAFYDRRLLLPAHDRARTEVTRLERDPRTHKIDHPPHGSKDVADAIAGVVYGLTMRREIWVRHNVPLTRIPRSLLASESPVKGSIPYLERLRREREMQIA